MLLENGVDLRVWCFDDYAYICAKSQEEALQFFLKELGTYDADEEFEIREVDMLKDGIYTDYSLQQVLKDVENLDSEEEITICRMAYIWYKWRTFKDILQEQIKENGIEEVSEKAFGLAYTTLF